MDPSRRPEPHTPASAASRFDPAAPPFAMHDDVSLAGDLARALTDAEFQKLRDLIHQKTGIDLAEGKKVLLASRLFRRIRALGLSSYMDYYRRVVADESGGELEQLINAITTNKTDFFRESHHFAFLRNEVLPRAAARAGRGGSKRLRIWSAGCSSGEEPYTIAMTVLDALGSDRSWDVRILATDLDTSILAKAQAGVYPQDRIEPVPAALASRFFTKGPRDGEVTVGPEAKQLVTFRQLNLIESPWPIRTTFDVVFFRNVAIYFDRPTQDRVLRGLASHLEPDGNLIVGHSESLHWMSDLLLQVSNTVYRLKGASPVRPAAPEAYVPPPAKPVAAPRPARAPLPPPAPPAAPTTVTETTTMRSRFGDQQLHVITVGGVFASGEPAIVRTLLGSCVAACLWDPDAEVGGMNHFLLPEGSGGGPSARFGVHAMELLINEIMKRGGDRRRLKAKVFGAGHVLHAHGFDSQVPKRNADFVRDFLHREGIPIVSERLLGRLPLEVRFQTDSGRAFVRALEPSTAARVEREEETYVEEAKHTVETPATNGVELF